MPQNEDVEIRIRCNPNTRKKFFQLKYELGLKNGEEVLLFLINNYESTKKMKPHIV